MIADSSRQCLAAAGRIMAELEGETPPVSMTALIIAIVSILADQEPDGDERSLDVLRESVAKGLALRRRPRGKPSN